MANLFKGNGKVAELLRFVVCGIAAALSDYLICQLIVLVLGPSFDSNWATVISTAGGFVVGVVVNYLISTYWVYQNVDKSVKTKSAKFVVLFVLLSACAMALSIFTMLGCEAFVNAVWSESIVSVSIMDMLKEFGFGFLGQFVFWAYFISFCLKTLVGLVFNYFTRKYILYKAPKE